jgi:uncharacterized protein
MTNNTADPYAAQAHARAMADIMVEAMPKLPPSDGLIWEEILAGGGYTSRRLSRGSLVTMTDLEGDACASVLLFNAECPVERLNVADTVKVQWNAYLGTGKLLLSDMGRVMMTITADDAGTHDCFCGASNAAVHDRKYGNGSHYGPCPSARDRFLVALAKYGLGRKDVHPCVNFFKGMRIDAEGGTQAELGPFSPGRAITLRAEMDLILVVTNVPHVLDDRPEYKATPLRIEARKAAVTDEADAFRNATPEGLRAFLNTEDYYRR